MKRKLAIMIPLLCLVLGGPAYFVFSYGEEDRETPTQKESENLSVSVEIITNDKLSELESSPLSWSGEILSFGDVQIHAQREGQIRELFVRVGNTVREGQVIGRLTVPPPSAELAGLLGEKTQALHRARASKEAAEKLARDSRVRLSELLSILEASRDASLVVIGKEAEQKKVASEGATKEANSIAESRQAAMRSAQAELEQAQAGLSVKTQIVQFGAQRVALSLTDELMYGGGPRTAEEAYGMSVRLRGEYGMYTWDSRREYAEKLGKLFEELKKLQDKKSEKIDDSMVVEFIKAALELLKNSNASMEIPQTKITELRQKVLDAQKVYLDAIKDYTEGVAIVKTKEADVQKIAAENQKEITTSQTKAMNAQQEYLSTDAQGAKTRAIANVDFSKEKTEVEKKISDLERDLRLAEGELAGSEAAYKLVASWSPGQEIRAIRSGIISGVFKNTGDQVQPDTLVASIGTPSAKGRFVRFRVPGDVKLPHEGDEVTVERPGFPRTRIKARISGVGTAIDITGSYMAEAEFLEFVEWPVRTAVRVTDYKWTKSVAIPVSAVWFDDVGKPNVWIVMENDVIRKQEVRVGRAIGDKLEVLDGLAVGDRYASRPTKDFKAGQLIRATKSEKKKEEKSPKEGQGDGHDHEH